MKGMKRFFSVMFALTLIVATAAGSYATSAPGWYLNKDYHEGDYVKFRGGIYIVTKDHESSQDKYPGNSAYWTFYKKGAGFKKDAPPTENDYEKPNDRDRDDDRNDGRNDKDPVDQDYIYRENGVHVYYEVTDADSDGYTAEITIENNGDRDIDDWSLSFEFDDDEEVDEIDADFEVDQDDDEVLITPESEMQTIEEDESVTFEIEILADYTLDDEDEDETYEDLVDLPSDFDLTLEFEAVETGAVIIQLEDPDFDDDIFIPEITVGDDDQEIEWGEEALFTDLVADKTYEIKAESYKEDGKLYRAVIDEDEVSVDSEELKVIEISYEEIDLDEETGKVLVYVFKPTFDEDLFTPEVTIDSEEKTVDWGEYVYFEDLEDGETFDIEVDSYEVDGEEFEPELSVEEIEVDKDKIGYVLIKFIKQ